MRFITPIVFLLAGGWVWWHNSTSPDAVVVLPFLDVLTSNVQEQGRYTAWICLGIGGWLLLWHGVAALRADRDRLGG